MTGVMATKVKQYLARESSGGKLYLLACDTTKDPDEPYKLFAREVQGLDTPEGFDTGNVDIDLFELTPLTCGIVKELVFPGD